MIKAVLLIEKNPYRIVYFNVLPLLFILLMASLSAEAKPVKINVEGADSEQKRNLLAHLGKIEPEQLSNPNKLEKKLLSASMNALQGLGYFDSSFSLVIKEKTLNLVIKAGEVVNVLEVTMKITGAGKHHSSLLPAIKQLESLLKQPFNSGQYAKYKRSLLSIAIQNGFLDAAYHRHVVKIDRENHSASIDLAFHTGEEYALGEFTLQASAIQNHRIRKMMTWQSGDIYNPQKLINLQRRLLDTGFFSTVLLKREKDVDQRRLNVHATTKMASKNRLELGTGFGTDSGPRAKASWQKPWINDHGHSTRAELGGSHIKQYFAASYRVPRFTAQESFWSTELNLVDEDFEDTRSRQQIIGMAYIVPLSHDWKSSIGIRYALEQFTQGTEEGRSELLLPSLNINLTQSEGGLIPRKGKSFSLDIDVANDSILSDASFVRLTGHTRWISSYKKHRFVSGIQLGAIYLYDGSSFNDIPSSLRFFAGGDQSIRGYEYKSLSPTNENNDLIGGQYLSVAKLEYSYRFFPNWRGALFVDGGSAFSDTDDSFFYGPGFGVHWLSPIGAIRFDLGFAVNEDQSIRLHINLGPEL